MLPTTIHNLKASDPRDRIFALLGMATSKLGLIADYISSCAEASIQAAAAILREGHMERMSVIRLQG